MTGCPLSHLTPGCCDIPLWPVCCLMNLSRCYYNNEWVMLSLIYHISPVVRCSDCSSRVSLINCNWPSAIAHKPFRGIASTKLATPSHRDMSPGHASKLTSFVDAQESGQQDIDIASISCNLHHKSNTFLLYYTILAGLLKNLDF